MTSTQNEALPSPKIATIIATFERLNTQMAVGKQEQRGG